jgi:hypothetical protein
MDKEEFIKNTGFAIQKTLDEVLFKVRSREFIETYKMPSACNSMEEKTVQVAPENLKS